MILQHLVNLGLLVRENHKHFHFQPLGLSVLSQLGHSLYTPSWVGFEGALVWHVLSVWARVCLILVVVVVADGLVSRTALLEALPRVDVRAALDAASLVGIGLGLVTAPAGPCPLLCVIGVVGSVVWSNTIIGTILSGGWNLVMPKEKVKYVYICLELTDQQKLVFYHIQSRPPFDGNHRWKIHPGKCKYMYKTKTCFKKSSSIMRLSR